MIKFRPKKGSPTLSIQERLQALRAGHQRSASPSASSTAGGAQSRARREGGSQSTATESGARMTLDRLRAMRSGPREDGCYITIFINREKNCKGMDKRKSGKRKHMINRISMKKNILNGSKLD